MKDIELRVGPQPEGKSPEALMALFDREVEDFSAFMANLADWRAAGPLNSGEKALMKSYLVHKYRGRF